MSTGNQYDGSTYNNNKQSQYLQYMNNPSASKPTKQKNIPKKKSNNNNNASLKHQLRSKKRLLQKLTNDKDATSVNTLKEDINLIQTKIIKSEKTHIEIKNAKQYHKIKFFDRITLSRIETKLRNKLKTASDPNLVKEYDNELNSVGNDQMYVAYYPNDMKYISLFTNNGKRVIDTSDKIKKQRLLVRDTIDKEYKDRSELKHWITAFQSNDEYYAKNDLKKKKTKTNKNKVSKDNDHNDHDHDNDLYSSNAKKKRLVPQISKIENDDPLLVSSLEDVKDERFQIKNDSRFQSLLQAKPDDDDIDDDIPMKDTNENSNDSGSDSDSSSSSSSSGSSSSSSSSSDDEQNPTKEDKDNDNIDEEDDDFFQTEDVDTSHIFQVANNNNHNIPKSTKSNYEQHMLNSKKGKHLGYETQSHQQYRNGFYKKKTPRR